jgi:hypothetical protein
VRWELVLRASGEVEEYGIYPRGARHGILENTKGLGAGGPLLFLTFGVRGWVGWDGREVKEGKEGKGREAVAVHCLLFSSSLCGLKMGLRREKERKGEGKGKERKGVDKRKVWT